VFAEFTVVEAIVAPSLHAYVPPPEAVNIVLPPTHIVVAPLIEAVVVVIVTVDCAVLVQPLFVTVTVKVFAAFTVVEAVVPPSLHAYMPPPDAVNIVLPPAHIVVAPLIVAVTVVRVTVDWAVLVQPLFVTVTV